MKKTRTLHQKPKYFLLPIVAVCIVTIAVYYQMKDHEFLDYDDNVYVTENHRVQEGITWQGIVWSFTTGHGANWHPVTWISHMVDCGVFGVNATFHHFMNLLLHVASTLVLFVVLHRMTGAYWMSVLVAAVFALHPLHVESVAWVAERKDVLSGLFWMLTLGAYIHYVERPSARRYGLLLLLFALGLMSKPMLVTLPFVLLLLDFWPLGRMKTGITQLFREKVPLFILIAGSSVATFLVQQAEGVVESVDRLSLSTRLANAITAYGLYIWKAVWPEGLCVIYPYPDSFSFLEVTSAAAVLAGITGIVLWRRRAQPFLFTGWFWFLGTLVPVIGLVQVGVQRMADRYMYIPLIGLAMMVVWGVGLYRPRSPVMRQLISIAGVLVVLLYAGASWIQIGYWEDSEILFTRALEVTTFNYVAHEGVGYAKLRKGRIEEALVHYETALSIKPNHANAYLNVANAMVESGRSRDAIEYYKRAIELKTNYVDAHNNLGIALYNTGDLGAAEASIARALNIDQGSAAAHNTLGLIAFARGDTNRALLEFRKTLELNPLHADAHSNLGAVLFMLGHVQDAIRHYREALRLKPNHSLAAQNLQRALQSIGK